MAYFVKKKFTRGELDEKHWLKLCLILVLLAGVTFQSAQADQGPCIRMFPSAVITDRTLFNYCAEGCPQRDTNGFVDLLVIPITYGRMPTVPPTVNARRTLLWRIIGADRLRLPAMQSSYPIRPAMRFWRPFLIRSDAYLQSNLDLFRPDLDGMYILGGGPNDRDAGGCQYAFESAWLMPFILAR